MTSKQNKPPDREGTQEPQRGAKTAEQGQQRDETCRVAEGGESDPTRQASPPATETSGTKSKQVQTAEWEGMVAQKPVAPKKGRVKKSDAAEGSGSAEGAQDQSDKTARSPREGSAGDRGRTRPH